MRYRVEVKKSAVKRLHTLPTFVQKAFEELVEELQAKGPWRPEWPNYSKLGANKYHCHLNYSHVACWTHEKNTIIIEVYYVGSRKDAPY